MSGTGGGQRLTLITSNAELVPALEAAARAGAVGLDTEFLREKTYRARLCLVQMSVGDDVYVLDPLGDIGLDPVASLISDPRVEVVVHAGRQDLDIFFEQYGSTPKSVFDVQIAAGFTGHGASLPYGRLVQSVLGVQLHKGEAYSDWCRRPLTDAQLRYAADDVRYLVAAAAALEAQASRLGRGEWLAEEMLALGDASSYGVDVNEAWRKVGGRGSLSGRQLAVLRFVARWREETAMRRDIPRGWVLKDPTLVELARRQPPTAEALRGIRGLSPREAERSGQDLVAAIERGKSSPPLATAQGPPKEAQARARMVAGVADAVVRARCEAAQIAYELVATRAELEGVLAEVFSGSVNRSGRRLLTGWRRDLAGDAVVALAAGKIAVRAAPEPPYVSEVPL